MNLTDRWFRQCKRILVSMQPFIVHSVVTPTANVSTTLRRRTGVKRWSQRSSTDIMTIISATSAEEGILTETSGFIFPAFSCRGSPYWGFSVCFPHVYLWSIDVKKYNSKEKVQSNAEEQKWLLVPGLHAAMTVTKTQWDVHKEVRGRARRRTFVLHSHLPLLVFRSTNWISKFYSFSFKRSIRRHVGFL